MGISSLGIRAYSRIDLCFQEVGKGSTSHLSWSCFDPRFSTGCHGILEWHYHFGPGTACDCETSDGNICASMSLNAVAQPRKMMKTPLGAILTWFAIWPLRCICQTTNATNARRGCAILDRESIHVAPSLKMSRGSSERHSPFQ